MKSPTAFFEGWWLSVIVLIGWWSRSRISDESDDGRRLQGRFFSRLVHSIQYYTRSQRFFFLYFDTTGWFKRKTPNFFRRQCPRRFWEIDPEILHTCSMRPCRAINDFFFLFFRQIYIFFVCWGIFGSEGNPHFPRKQTNKTTHSLKAPQGHTKHVQNFRVYLSKTAWTFGVLCG